MSEKYLKNVPHFRKDISENIRKGIMTGDFPLNLENISVIEEYDEETQTKLIKDNASGKNYILTAGYSESQLREEHCADMCYAIIASHMNDCGYVVPRSKMYNHEGRWWRLIEDTNGYMVESYNELSDDQKQIVKKSVNHTFAIDALLGNMTPSEGCIIIGEDNVIYRINNYSAFRYADGERLKPSKDFGVGVTYLWWMRYPWSNELSYLYNDLNDWKICYEIIKLAQCLKDTHSYIVGCAGWCVGDESNLPYLLHERIENFRSMAKFVAKMLACECDPADILNFCRHQQEMHNDNIWDYVCEANEIHNEIEEEEDEMGGWQGAEGYRSRLEEGDEGMRHSGSYGSSRGSWA